MGQEGREDTTGEIRRKQREQAATLPGRSGGVHPDLGCEGPCRVQRRKRLGPGSYSWVSVTPRCSGHVTLLCLVPCGGAAWSSAPVRPLRSWGISSWARCPSSGCPSSSPQGRADFAHLPALPTSALLLRGLFLPSFVPSGVNLIILFHKRFGECLRRDGFPANRGAGMDPALACVAGFTVHFGGSQRSPGWIRFVGSWGAIKKVSVAATHPPFPAEPREHTATPPPTGTLGHPDFRLREQ